MGVGTAHDKMLKFSHTMVKLSNCVVLFDVHEAVFTRRARAMSYSFGTFGNLPANTRTTINVGSSSSAIFSCLAFEK